MNNLICIICPKGCHLEVDENMNVTGNSCNRGKIYALNEISNPVRMITSTIKVKNGVINRVSVVTSNPVPKDKMFDIMKEINKIEVEAPIKIKDVLIHNVLNLGVDIIATKNIEVKK